MSHLWCMTGIFPHLLSFTHFTYKELWLTDSYVTCSNSQLGKYQGQNSNPSLILIPLPSLTIAQQWYVQISKQALENEGSGRHRQLEESLFPNARVSSKVGGYLFSGLRIPCCRELWHRLQTWLGSCVAAAVGWQL